MLAYPSPTPYRTRSVGLCINICDSVFFNLFSFFLPSHQSFSILFHPNFLSPPHSLSVTVSLLLPSLPSRLSLASFPFLPVCSLCCLCCSVCFGLTVCVFCAVPTHTVSTCAEVSPQTRTVIPGNSVPVVVGIINPTGSRLLSVLWLNIYLLLDISTSYFRQYDLTGPKEFRHQAHMLHQIIRIREHKQQLSTIHRQLLSLRKRSSNL
jgi:hypothetical protein